ncbi:hypothetical protein Ocin01_14926, partial [Orchesella cincta]
MEMDIGNWNLKLAAEPGKSERVDRYMIWILEQLVHHILLAQEETGSNVTRSVVIADAENLGFRQHLCSACISTLRRWNSLQPSSALAFLNLIFSPFPISETGPAPQYIVIQTRLDKKTLLR